jgi:hypothetical protein
MYKSASLGCFRVCIYKPSMELGLNFKIQNSRMAVLKFISILTCIYESKVKVKQSHYRPGQAKRFPGG